MSLSEPFRVLIVDRDGDTRAPAGERFLRRELSTRGIERDRIAVDSAGLEAHDGEPMDAAAAALVAHFGAEPGGYVQRTVSAEALDGVDMIICGDAADRDELVSRFPFAAKRAFSLSEMFYLYEHVVAIAPLREHPALLSNRLEEAKVATDYDLPSREEARRRPEALAHQIMRSAFWIATIWQSMLPASAEQMPVAITTDVPVDLDAFGVSVRVVCHGEMPRALAIAIDVAWNRQLAPTPHEDPEVTVHLAVIADADAAAQARQEGWLVYDSVDQAMHFLSSTVTVRAIDARAGQLVMLHAAGLSDSEGRVVAFVAPSGTGKTTMARTLGQHYGYVTDETLAVGFDGAVTPYPKPLSVLADRASALKTQVAAMDLDLVVPVPDLRLARVVILNRDPDGPAEPLIESMPLLHGLAVIAEQTSYLPRLPGKLHTLAEVIEAAGGVWRVTYRESAQLARLVPALAAGTFDYVVAEMPTPAGGVA